LAENVKFICVESTTTADKAPQAQSMRGRDVKIPKRQT